MEIGFKEPCADRQQFLKKVQMYQFAAYDLQLYLDTHPNDKKAFEMFRDLVMKHKEAVKEYEAKFGPLSAFHAANFDRYNWLDDPWPWDNPNEKEVIR